MSDIHGKYIWAELMTTDVEAATDFYGKLTGWTTAQMTLPGLPPYTVLEASGSGAAGVMTFPPELEGRIPPNWTGYIGVDDVDRTAGEVVANGGAVQRPPEDIPYVGRFAVVADPHGAVICIMTPLPMDNAPPEAAAGTPGTLGWLELCAGNGDEAFAFYAKIFGWTEDHVMDMGALGGYRIFADHGKPVGGMMTKMEGMPACWNYYWNVEAIDAAIASITAGGGKVVHGPMEVPGGGWIVQGTDPQGAFFSLVAPRR